jgi:hypothetical protein
MPPIMQWPLGVTTSGHLSNRQVIRPEPATILHYPGQVALRCLNPMGKKGPPFFRIWVKSQQPHPPEYRHLDVIVDKHDSFDSVGVV